MDHCSHLSLLAYACSQMTDISNALTNSKAIHNHLQREAHSRSNSQPNEQLLGTCTKPELSTLLHCMKFRCRVYWAASRLSPERANQHCSFTLFSRSSQNTRQRIKNNTTFHQLRFLAKRLSAPGNTSPVLFGPSAWEASLLLLLQLLRTNFFSIYSSPDKGSSLSPRQLARL